MVKESVKNSWILLSLSFAALEENYSVFAGINSENGTVGRLRIGL